MKKVKKYSDFVLALVVLIISIVAAIVVVKLVVDKNGGSLFPKNVEVVTNTKTVVKKSTKSYSDDDDSVGTIFIGDSRFVGMDKACDIGGEDRQFCVAKIGEGLNWFQKSAMKQIDKIKKENTALTKWRYVVCLGVNDLGNIDNYIKEYDKLTSENDDIQLILVSVNPVKNYATITNSSIQKFNAKLMDAGYDYIDSYSKLVKDGYETTDGLHYTDETYESIYEIIKDGLEELNS